VCPESKCPECKAKRPCRISMGMFEEVTMPRQFPTRQLRRIAKRHEKSGSRPARRRTIKEAQRRKRGWPCHANYAVTIPAKADPEPSLKTGLSSKVHEGLGLLENSIGEKLGDWKMPRRQPRQYRKRRCCRRPAMPPMRRMNNLIYDAAGLALGVGVLGAIVNTSTNMWSK